MSLSLTIVFQFHGMSDLAYNRLQLDTNLSEILKPVRAAAADQIQHALSWYGDEGIDEITEDAYGTPLRQMSAERLYWLLKPHHALMSAWDTACLSFLAALPANTMLILFWA